MPPPSWASLSAAEGRGRETNLGGPHDRASGALCGCLAGRFSAEMLLLFRMRDL